MTYEIVIGIEVHAQLKTNTKLFCGCSTQFGKSPNTNVCPVCLGLPGALPVLNEKVAEFAIFAGLALNCDIHQTSVFSRKNYFYPDLPKGYQISQFDLPICTNGALEIEADGNRKTIRVMRIHIEEDAGKLIHQGADSIKGATHSLVDLNRACTPLLEIVSEPDIRSIKEARAYVEQLKLIIQHIGICDGNLEEGSMRADINISLRPIGQKEFGTRTEIKNINSFRSLERAIKSEVQRQTDVLNSGGTIIQQTRNYDDATQKTSALRSKEDAHDYRYFPEPDLLPLILDKKMIDEKKQTLPELPMAKKHRYQHELKLTEQETETLINDYEMCQYFERCLNINTSLSPRDICKWVVGDIIAHLKELKLDFHNIPVSASQLIQLLSTIQSGKINRNTGKEVFKTCAKTGQDPESIIKSMGVTQISDETELQTIIQKILDENMDIVEKLKTGNMKPIGFVIGQVMKQTKGQANADLVRSIILKLIS